MKEGKTQTTGTDNQLFYDAFVASSIGIALEDLEGRPLFVNPALCTMLGFSEEELRKKHCVEFSPPEDAEKDLAYFEQLRAGTIDRYQLDKRFFRRDGSMIWGRLSISLLNNRPSSRVVAMVEDITERKTAQEDLSRHAAIVESSQDAIISKSLQGVIRTWNGGARRMLGYTEEEAIGQSILMIIPSELHDEEKNILGRLAVGERIENYETVSASKDGKRIDVSLTISPVTDAAGMIIGASMIARDITQRKLADDALSKMNQRLIEAQEEERNWIARELHDDINQRIALLALELERLNQDPSDAEKLRQEIAEGIKQLNHIAGDVQALSHRLHSSKLEYLGLAAAAALFCKELSDRQKVKIDFCSENIPKDLSEEISICLFRVLQEALKNAVKHSGSQHIQVSLRVELNEIRLTVRDSGAGFDPKGAMKAQGIGLVSMKERLKLVGGTLSIDSQLHSGTTVQARVPVSGRTKRAGAGG
jgi:PAS domain S-box-containing protein